MLVNHIIKESVPFAQFSSVKLTETFNPLFDVEQDTDRGSEYYCQQLISKVFSITHSQIPEFICHHCKQVSESMLWLNKFEKLISVNDELFKGERGQSRLVKLYTSIESKRNTLKSIDLNVSLLRPNKKQINAESEERYFSFWELKNKLATLSNDNEKILLLMEEKFEYLQANIEFVNRNLQDYNLQCKKEIEHLYALKKLKEEISKTDSPEVVQKSFQGKIKLHGPTNILVHAFKQMMYGLKPNGNFYIQMTNSELADFICDSFLDQHGKTLSKSTVLTYLSPTRTDKDPNNDSAVTWKSDF